MRRERETTVVAAIIRREGRVLLTRRPASAHHGGLWEFPGGKAETGEPPEAALRREIREELGRDVEVGALYDRVQARGADGGALTLLFLECGWPGGEPLHLGVDEHRWVEPRELASFALPPADRKVVERLGREVPPRRLP